MPTSDGVEEEKPEVDDSWVIRQDSGGRPFWCVCFLGLLGPRHSLGF